ncbi:MAG: chorismate synthase [Pseudobdellovibrio sp.]
MSANIFGERLKMISFGESHGPSYGVVIDGFPANVNLDINLLLKNLARRKPGQNQFVTARNEDDQPEILSGFYEDKSLGTPIAVIVRNKNQKSQDYNQIKNQPRIGHADDTWQNKFGHADHRGGGRSSGRETLNRVIAGSFAEMFLKQKFSKQTPTIGAYPVQIADYIFAENEKKQSDLPLPVQALLVEAKQNGESYGGIVECRIQNMPKGLGQPIFHKFKSDLAQAMMSIGAVNGFELGAGFTSNDYKGTEFHSKLDSENYGGIRGGITTGEDVVFRLVFKPTSSIKDVAKKGRHDPCIIPRAIPVVESMAWFVLADHVLWAMTDRV